MDAAAFKTKNPKPYPCATFGHKANAILVALKLQVSSIIENACIALALRLCSEIALPVVNAQLQHLKHERTTRTYLHVLLTNKTRRCLMSLRWQLPSDVEKACIVEIPKSLSPYACAAKSPFRCRHQCKNNDQRQPEMLITPLENQ